MLALCYVSEMLTKAWNENMGEKMNAVQMNTRMPEELKLFLLEQAKKEGRSLNNYLVRHFAELKTKLTSENAKA